MSSSDTTVRVPDAPVPSANKNPLVVGLAYDTRDGADAAEVYALVHGRMYPSFPT